MDLVNLEKKNEAQLNTENNVTTKANFQLIKDIEALSYQSKLNKIYQYTEDIQRENLSRITKITEELMIKLSGLTSFYNSESFIKISKSTLITISETLANYIKDIRLIIKPINSTPSTDLKVNELATLLEGIPVR